NCPNPSCPLSVVVTPARAVALRVVGGHPAHRRLPLPSGGTLRAGWLVAVPCDLVVGKSHPLQAGHGRALPLRPGLERTPPLAGRPRVGATPMAWLRASVALTACDSPCKGPSYGQPPPFLTTRREENKRQ
ncbi:hypothetical protein BHE74_00016089, partial [Ensete ventricosum]